MSLDSKNSRSAFGENWTRFLAVLNEDRIKEAECSPRQMLQVERQDDNAFSTLGRLTGYPASLLAD